MGNFRKVLYNIKNHQKMPMKRRTKKVRIVKKRSSQKRKAARSKKYRVINNMNVKCVAFHIHQYKDTWA